jgi:hypothetical protein
MPQGWRGEECIFKGTLSGKKSQVSGEWRVVRGKACATGRPAACDMPNRHRAEPGARVTVHDAERVNFPRFFPRCSSRATPLRWSDAKPALVRALGAMPPLWHGLPTVPSARPQVSTDRGRLSVVPVVRSRDRTTTGWTGPQREWAWCKFSPLGMATQSRGHGPQDSPAHAAFVHTACHCHMHVTNHSGHRVSKFRQFVNELSRSRHR